jgi:outer membrane protein
VSQTIEIIEPSQAIGRCRTRLAGQALIVLVCILLASHPVLADSKPPTDWGLAIGVRTASVPFEADVDHVNDIVPLMYYHGERFNLHGLSSWYKLVPKKHWEINALARFRFLDFPEEYQEEFDGNALDYGIQLKYIPLPYLDVDLEFMIDQRGKYHIASYTNYRHETGRWTLLPFGRIRWKSADFNNLYYGLDIDTPGSGIDAKIGSDVRFHVWRNLHLIGRVAAGVLDSNTADSDVIDSQFQGEFFFGIGFFSDPGQEPPPSLTSDAYLRLGHGWATPSSLQEIITFQSVPDEENNQLTSLFYGHPLADELFGLPFSIYLTPGLVRHHRSDVQDPSFEYVLAMKLYYTFNWPIAWRLGCGEGLSYASEITYIEAEDMADKGFTPSNLMNYLDLSLDLNLGELFRARSLEDLWLGYYIHHRSGMFETSSLFGNIKGGSNYNCVYLQYHF